MKKPIAAIGLFAASLVLFLFSSLTAEANAQLLDRTLSLANLSLELKTPENIAHYMWRNFVFETDQRQFGREEYWQSPQELMQTRKGDCEDFAVFAYELLKRQGIQTFLLNVYGGSFAHTVCVFKDKGKYQIIDGSDIKRVNASSLDELSKKIYPFWEPLRKFIVEDQKLFLKK